jgi:hypothetical protein
MHLPRFWLRFSVRRLLIAVAILAVILAAWMKSVQYWDLSTQYQERVAWFESMADDHRSRIDSWDTLIARKKKDPASDGFTLELFQDQAKRDRIWLAYDRGLIAKYKRATRYPWLSVAPDPPDPIGNPPFPTIVGKPPVLMRNWLTPIGFRNKAN